MKQKKKIASNKYNLGAFVTKNQQAITGITNAAGALAPIAGNGAVSGALSGLSAGASVGSLIPGVGTLIGGGIGLVGGAIKGDIRADFFWGYGEDAFAYAGRMKEKGKMYVLMPKK